MVPARPVGPGFFPLDEELGVLPGSLSPQSQDHLARLATWMPFDRAAEMLSALTGVQVSEASTFAEQASVETRRRGVADARQVCAVMGGAEWIDGVVDLQCPEALRILDFPHAAQVVSAIGQEAGMSQSQASAPWLTTQLHTLKHEGPAPVLAELARLCALFPLNEQMNKAYAYLARRQGRMQYHQYQQDGWPIGSGIVESGNKVVMQARLKGAGMHWAPSHVNPMLALRTAVCNDRWDEAQQQLRAYQQAQRHLRRQRLVLQRARHQVCRTLLTRIGQRMQEPPPLQV